MKTEYASMAEARAKYLKQGFVTINSGIDTENRMYYIMGKGNQRVELRKTGLLQITVTDR